MFRTEMLYLSSFSVGSAQYFSKYTLWTSILPWSGAARAINSKDSFAAKVLFLGMASIVVTVSASFPLKCAGKVKINGPSSSNRNNQVLEVLDLRPLLREEYGGSPMICVCMAASLDAFFTVTLIFKRMGSSSVTFSMETNCSMEMPSLSARPGGWGRLVLRLRVFWLRSRVRVSSFAVFGTCWAFVVLFVGLFVGLVVEFEEEFARLWGSSPCWSGSDSVTWRDSALTTDSNRVRFGRIFWLEKPDRFAARLPLRNGGVLLLVLLINR